MSQGRRLEVASKEAVAIACSLDAQGYAARAAEFRAAFVHLRGTEDIPGGFRWRLGPEAGLESLQALAERERACCPFFDFRVVMEGDEIAWSCRAMAAARPVLEELRRLPQTLSSGGELPRFATSAK